MTKPSHLSAMRPLLRELRAKVADRRTEDDLCRLAWGCGIRVRCVGPDRWEAAPFVLTVTPAVNADGEIVRDRVVRDERFLALASDRTARSALRRLLDSSPNACVRAALTGPITMPAVLV